MSRVLDVVVIGAGQAGLATGFYLRRSGLTHALLDDQPGPGGAWRHGWPSLRLFSPTRWSSLPGWLMPHEADAPGDGDAYPARDDVLAYLAEYERRYALPVERPVRVDAVRRVADGAGLQLDTSAGTWTARAVVSATGSWAVPVTPAVPGAGEFRGAQLHSAHYAGPAAFAGRHVVVVGGGNSGAQIAAELGDASRVTWATRAPPAFLPDHVDGRHLFEQATARYAAIKAGRAPEPPRSLGDVVAVPPVRRARDAGRLTSVRMFVRMTPGGVVWADGREEAVDAVIWCTGFRPALAHLRPLGVAGDDGRVVTAGAAGTRAAREPRLWLVGYGEWTGFASATLVGVGRSARATVEEVAGVVSGERGAGSGER